MRHLFFAVFLAVFNITSLFAAEQPVDYNRDIRPLLSNTCYQCHGPDEGERQAELRFDIKDKALGEVESGGLAIVPGNSNASAVYQRIAASDESERMPPAQSGKSLTADQIELIKKWIDQGAPWREHWSFINPQRPDPPKVEDASRVRNPIDQFIQTRLSDEGMQPSDEAGKTTLIRRVTFDLTGLPPTLNEVDAFLADDSANAYETLVERLLKSPRYGEHMTRHWLDLARYGDTHGLHLDNKRQIWPYRDWLIRAFNNNMPFDQFTIEQLAGDLLPDATPDQIIATGFNRCNVTTSEGGSIAEEYRVRYAVDRVETTATVWMGLTAGCAVCHDHKFDPLSQTEFYRLYGYFYNFAENEMDGNALLPAGPTVDAPTAEQTAQLTMFAADLSKLSRELEARRNELAGKQVEWEKAILAGIVDLPSAPADTVVYLPLDEASGDKTINSANAEASCKVVGQANWQSGKYANALQFDGNTHVEVGEVASFERTESFSYGAWIRPANEDHMTVLSKMDDAGKFRGYDLYLGGGLVYVHIIHQWDNNAIRLNTTNKLKVNEWQHVMITYDGSSKAEGVKIYVNGKPVNGTITHNGLSGTIKTDKSLKIGRRTPAAPMFGTIDELRIYHRQLSDSEVELVAGANPIAEIVNTEPSKRIDKQREVLQDYYLTTQDDVYKNLKAKSAETTKQIEATKAAIPKTMVMGDRPNKTPVYRLVRGEYDKPDTSIELKPGVPSALPRMPNDAATNRLALAQWLVSREHPLTARVTANRLWQQLFGTGIVKTSEDFGSQGQWPSHPELLDWLAVEFMESGWDVKHIVKLMVMSHTYRQSAQVTPDRLAKDKNNRLLSRGPRFRLDAEMVRDNALAISGLLVDKIGGPSVRPYQPSGIWEAVGYSGSNTVRFTQDHGNDLYRRSMYIFWKRTAPPPAMQIFDAPSREYCVMRRERTNTPGGALVLMNDTQFVEASRKFAERILTEPEATSEDRINFAFRTATARPPEADELQVIKEMYEKLLNKYQNDKDAATKLVSVGESPRNEKLDVGEHAAWTMIANAILNLDETITK